MVISLVFLTNIGMAIDKTFLCKNKKKIKKLVKEMFEVHQLEEPEEENW